MIFEQLFLQATIILIYKPLLTTHCSHPIANFGHKKRSDLISHFSSAEKEGFEPPVHCCTTVFKTAAFDRSAISPLQRYNFFFPSKKFYKNFIFIYKQRIINNLQNLKQLFYANKIKIQDKNEIKNITKRLKKMNNLECKMNNYFQFR